MNSSTKPEAFKFETEFDPNGSVVSSQNSFKRYRQNEVDELCEQARQAGIQSEEAEAARRMAAATEAILNNLMPVAPFARQLAAQMRKEALQLALEASKKIAGAALDSFPEEAVIESLNHVIEYLPNGEKLVLSVSPDLANGIEEHVRRALPEGTVLVVEEDENAAPGVWRLDWNSGGFTHNPEELTARLDEIIASHLERDLDEQGDLFAALA